MARSFAPQTGRIHLSRPAHPRQGFDLQSGGGPYIPTPPTTATGSYLLLPLRYTNNLTGTNYRAGQSPSSDAILFLVASMSGTFTGKVGLSLASTALDFAGSVPVVNEVTGSIQIGAGIVSAGITVYRGNVNNAGFAGTGIGLALAGRTLGKGAAETIPVLGNAVSFLSGVYDVFGSGGVIDTYKSCLAGR